MTVASSELVFGKFMKLRRLAVGGMGEIFLARQVGVSGFERLVILKSLLPEYARADDRIDAFLDEARVAARLNHPNVISILEVGEWEGTFFIAMEYVDGLDLSQLQELARQRESAMPVRATLEAVRDAARGLDHAHNARDARGMPLQLVHRDVSPQNLMARLDGVTKVVDFGIAKVADRIGRTKPGAVKGKIRYMSPEQLRAETLDGRCDQFALGVVLWELLTGQRLYDAPSPAQVMKQIVQLPTPPPSSKRPDLPPALDAVVLRMVAKLRDQRFPRLEEVARALDQVLDALPVVPGSGLAEVVERLAGAEVRARSKVDELPPALTAVAPTESLRCGQCKALHRGTARFCSQCGAPLGAGLTPERPTARPVDETSPNVLQSAAAAHVAQPTPTPSVALEVKNLKRSAAVVVVRFTQREAWLSSLGEEDRLERSAAWLDLCAEEAERWEGLTLQLGEEQATVLFGVPVARGDDPVRAGRFAEALVARKAARSEFQALALRTGLDAGTVLVSGGGLTPWRAAGAPLDRASQLAQLVGDERPLAGPTLVTMAASQLAFGPAAREGAEAPRPLLGPRDTVEITPPAIWGGRGAEQTRLEEWARQGGRRGNARLLLRGEAGLGKSTLLAQGAELAATHGLRPLRVAVMRGGGPPGLIRQLLHALAIPEGTTMPTLRTANARPAAPSSPLQGLEVLGLENAAIEAIGRRLGLPGRGPSADDAALLLPFRLAHARRPLALLVDDLDRADAPSLFLLARLLETPAGPALLGTTSPGVLPQPLDALASLELLGLDPTALAAWLAHVAEGPLPEAVVAAVHARSQGNPAFAAELVRSLIAQERLQRLGGRWQADPVRGLPALAESLSFAVGARLDRLDPATQAWAERAAQVGGPFPAAWVTASFAAEAMPPDEARCLTELSSAGVLLASPPEGFFTFAQEATAELLRRRATRTAARAAHLALAEALDAGASGLLSHPELALADHLLAAEAGPRAAEPCRRAGESLLGRAEWRAAAEYLGRALALTEPKGAAESLAALELAGRLAHALGQFDPPRALAEVEPWLTRLPPEQAPLAWAEAARHLARSELALARLDAAEARLAVAHPHTTIDPEAHAWLLGDWAQLRERRGDVQGAAKLLGKAFEAMKGRPSQDPDFYWVHLNHLGRILQRLNQPDRARSMFTQALAQARGAASLRGEARVLGNLAGMAAVTGDVAGALEGLATAQARALQSGDLQELARLAINSGRLLATRDATRAREQLERALGHARDAGWREGEALAAQALDGLRSSVPPQG